MSGFTVPRETVAGCGVKQRGTQCHSPLGSHKAFQRHHPSVQDSSHHHLGHRWPGPRTPTFTAWLCTPQTRLTLLPAELDKCPGPCTLGPQNWTRPQDGWCRLTGDLITRETQPHLPAALPTQSIIRQMPRGLLRIRYLSMGACWPEGHELLQTPETAPLRRSPHFLFSSPRGPLGR